MTKKDSQTTSMAMDFLPFLRTDRSMIALCLALIFSGLLLTVSQRLNTKIIAKSRTIVKPVNFNSL
jgi:hypothetical protein